jgi:hypothetical protein
MKATTIRLFLFSIFLFLFCEPSKSQTSKETMLLLPDTLNGWNRISDRTFNDSTLYSYIDGAAELYLSFGFSKVSNRIYSRAEQPDILVDIFYMNTSYDAFGVFTHTVGKTEKEFGAQSQHTQGAVVFWKSNYYVSIFANPETEESKTAITNLAKKIDSSIQGESVLPEVLNYLPENDIDRESIRYFKHYVWLNSYYNLSRENILDIDKSTHAVLAKYGTGKQKPVLLLIEYPSAQKAIAAHQKFISLFDKGFNNKSVLLHGKKWAGVELINQFFVGVFNSDNKNLTRALISSVRKKIENRQNIN